MAKTRHRRIEKLKRQERNRKYRKQKEFFSLIEETMNKINRLIRDILNHYVKQIKQFADSLRYVPV